MACRMLDAVDAPPLAVAFAAAQSRGVHKDGAVAPLSMRIIFQASTSRPTHHSIDGGLLPTTLCILSLQHEEARLRVYDAVARRESARASAAAAEHCRRSRAQVSMLQTRLATLSAGLKKNADGGGGDGGGAAKQEPQATAAPAAAKSGDGLFVGDACW